MPEPPSVVDTTPDRSLSFAPPDTHDLGSGVDRAGASVARSIGAAAALMSATMNARGIGLAVNTFPIQTSKVQAPPLRDETLRRDRLLDWLGVKIHGRLVLVTAEAGYGKTTLLADFARRTHIRTLWYRLDHDDRDWVSFLNYLVAAGRELDPEFAPITGGMLREIGNAGTTRDTIVQTFLREFQALGGTGAALVIDDYHIVDEVPEIRSLVRDLVARAPERFSLVFLSRRQPAVALARLRALGEVAELSTADLRFSESETDELFRETYRRPLEPDVLADLARRTDGWAASLQLVQTAIRARSASEVRAFVRSLTGARGDLYDYLAEEVVGELDQETQQFLMATAVLLDVTPELASVVTDLGETTVRRLVAHCERLGLLPRRSSVTAPATYHPLVRDFLIERLRREHGSGRLADLHRRAGAAADGLDWRVAAHHFAAAGDESDVLRVIQESIGVVLGAGGFAAAARYLDQIAAGRTTAIGAVVESRANLAEGDTAAALERATDATLRADPRSTQWASANLMSIRFMSGDFEAAAELAASLVSTATEPAIAAIAEASLRLVRSSIDDNLDEVRTLLLRLAHDQELAAQHHHLGVTLMNLADLAKAQGDAAVALEMAQSAVDRLRASSNGPELEVARPTVAWALRHLGRLEEAKVAESTAKDVKSRSVRAEVLGDLGDMASAYDDPNAATVLLQDAESTAQGDIKHYVEAAKARHLVRLGHPDQAWDLLQRIDARQPHLYSAFESMRLASVALAAVSLRRDDDIALCRDALAHATSQRAHYWRHVSSLLLGIAQSRGIANQAVDALFVRDPAYLSVLAELVIDQLEFVTEDTFLVISSEAALRSDRWGPPLRRHISGSNAKTGIRAAQLLELIGSRSDVPLLRQFARRSKHRPDAASIGRSLARRAATRVFVEDQGRVAIRMGSVELNGSDIRRKVLALLCYLISRPDLAATRDQALDALWPDSEPDVALNSLNQTVYFLRRVFEPDYSEDISPLYVRHDKDLIWLDQELIRTRSMLCKDLLNRIAHDDSLALVDELSSAYRGKFALDFSYDEWASPYREWIHAGYLEVVERSVIDDTDGGRFERGIRLARTAIDLDPEAEQIERSLVKLYRIVGAHAAAAEQYIHYASFIGSQGRGA